MNSNTHNQKAQKQSSGNQAHEQMGRVSEKNQSAHGHAQSASQQHAGHQQQNSGANQKNQQHGAHKQSTQKGQCASGNCKDSQCSGKTGCQ
ncbi:hypothetical protein BGZ95_011102 [Linnemannia exigua]|uniref:Uncharacterized protein n=1 Tax=Linnemannia exigua TaxID=604196 RepID=A0AAD4DC70_9FUNG|nr:hypothetical protein BGZ95_011102 [Linnemannia exigua]